MPLPNWIDGFLACFTGSTKQQPASNAFAGTDTQKTIHTELASTPKRLGDSGNGFLDLVPLFWSHIHTPDRLNLRLCCRESRRIHDSLVNELYVCDEGSMLSEVPPARLPRSPLPTCSETAAETGRVLQGFISRGCHPHLLLLCLSDGNERRRHEQGLAALLSISKAASELAVLHLAGVPLTPQTARALKSLLLASAPTATENIITTVSSAPPLRLQLYGYDMTRQPAAVALEMLMGAGSPRLARLELWGCVGWPKRLASALQTCSQLRRLAVSFQPLLRPDIGTHAGAGGDHHLHLNLNLHSSHAAQHTGAAATGALATFPAAAAAATATSVIKSIGALRQLHSLELRGCTFILSRAGSRPAPPTNRRGSRPGVVNKAAAAEKAAVAAAPTLQQLASAMFQLTGLTRLALDGLCTVTPLLTAMTCMRGLRTLELPDVSAAAADLAAIAQSVPRLVSLTVGAIGKGSILELRNPSERAAVAARAPEPLPLPPLLAALRVARYRPTLRTMRSLRLTLEAKAVATAGAGGDSDRMAVVVPGIEIDMMDVEFDPLQAFLGSEDAVMRSVLLPESAEALAAAIRLLATSPLPPSAPQSKATGGGAACGITRAEKEEDGGEESEPIAGQAWQQDLVIHNVQGSLTPAAVGSLTPAAVGSLTPAAVGEPVAAQEGCGGPAAHPADGHTAWLSEIRPLGLWGLELYGIGMEACDLVAVAELSTLRRLTLASGELAVESLPCLTSLPLLEYLELTRCSARHRINQRISSTRGDSHGGDGHGGDGRGGDGRAPGCGSKRALLELCMTAPALQRVLVVRCAGDGCGSAGAEGPLGAEWVRQQLAAMGPRSKWLAAKGEVGAVPGAGAEQCGGGGSEGRVRDWPEVSWD